MTRAGDALAAPPKPFEGAGRLRRAMWVTLAVSLSFCPTAAPLPPAHKAVHVTMDSGEADAVIARGQPSGRSPCADQTVGIRQAIRGVHEAQKNVGLAAAIFSRGRLAIAEYLGIADLENRVPVTPESRFGIASVTKAFTGVALLKLWEAGVVDLDAPVQKYVPAFPVKPEGAITLRLLAAHLAGIRHWKKERTPELYATHFDNVRDILSLFQDDPLESPPGTRYGYSSYGYDLLGVAIQAAAGEPYPSYIARAVLDPLALRATTFDDVRHVLPHRVRRYSYYDPVTYAESAEILRVPDWDYTHNMAAGNIVSTAEDLARFGNALARPGFLGVDAWTLLLTRPKTQRAESAMSFGWFVSAPDAGPREIHVTGSNVGVQAAVFVYPDADLVIVVLSNTWGINSRSAEMVDALPRHIAALCGVRQAPPQ